MAQSWEVVRKEARRLETDIESKLVEYSKLACSLHSSRSTALEGRAPADGVQRRTTWSKECAQMTNDMEHLLKQLSQTIETMKDMVQQEGMSKGSATSSHTLQRHTEILGDYTQEFRKTAGLIGAHREHAELLQGVTSSQTQGGSQGELGALYAESASISNSRRGADMALSSGMSLKEDLERQRAMFASMVERMESMSEGLPSVHRLIGQIRRKRKRDVLIVATVVGVMFFFTACWKVM